MQAAPASPDLTGLHDIVLPDPVAWTPQTAGWWILLGAAVVLAAWAVRSTLRRRRANRYRRIALARLARIEASLGDPAGRPGAVAELSVLIKWTALAFRPRSEVAALSGERWLRFLDDSYGGRGFTEGPGRLLPTLAYAPAGRGGAVADAEVTALVGLIRLWIRRHHVRV